MSSYLTNYRCPVIGPNNLFACLINATHVVDAHVIISYELQMSSIFFRITAGELMCSCIRRKRSKMTRFTQFIRKPGLKTIQSGPVYKGNQAKKTTQQRHPIARPHDQTTTALNTRLKLLPMWYAILSFMNCSPCVYLKSNYRWIRKFYWVSQQSKQFHTHTF
jgi:hypothetical protein